MAPTTVAPSLPTLATEISLLTRPSTPSKGSATQMSGKKKAAQSNSLTRPEDKALLKGWISTLKDDFINGEKKGNAPYTVINEFYNSRKPAYSQNRSDRFINLFVRKMLSERFPFFSCVAELSNSHPSGTNSNGVMDLSNKLHLYTV